MNLPVFSGDSLKRYIIDVNGNGCVWFDFNNDGWMDLFVAQGATLSALKQLDSRSYKNRLYLNLGDGSFREVTDQAGVGGPASGWAMGAVAADYDNDGWVDLFVTSLGPDTLYRNNGDGTFADCTEEAGLSGLTGWSTGATFGDYDGDGFVDLYVAGYIDFDLDNPPPPTCPYKGVEVMCGPGGLNPAPDFLFRNRGDGTFEDVTERALLARDFFDSYGFAAVFVDLNGDHLLDLYVANDQKANFLYRNNGNGTFSEIGLASGAAYSADGRAQAGMGIGVGDYNRDGRPDLVVTHFSDDYDTLYRNEGNFVFTDVSRQTNLAEASFPFMGWGAIFADFDRDGWEDLFVANGHLYPQVAQVLGGNYLQRNLIYRNHTGQTFQELGQLIPGFDKEALSRGAAVADFDNDGDMDIFIVDIDDTPSFLENRTVNDHNWVGFSITRPYGVSIKITTPSGVQYRYLVSGGSFLSQNDPRAFFGLGNDDRVLEVEIQWPGGKRVRLRELEINRYHSISYPDD
ncbi:MAG TPA: CRTAC1 family protein [Acidobacteriota bacterium]|nr:CRTAC1 family protein [Acidobacteriota bacterium]